MSYEATPHIYSMDDSAHKHAYLFKYKSIEREYMFTSLILLFLAVAQVNMTHIVQALRYITTHVVAEKMSNEE